MGKGNQQRLYPDGVAKIRKVLRDYFAPNAAGSFYREVGRVLRLKRTAQTMGDYLVRFDLLRRKAELGTQMGEVVPRDLRLNSANAECISIPY